MRNSAEVLNSLNRHSKDLNYKYERLYRILFNTEMYAVAYQRIATKQGNMTEGTDGKTIDGKSIKRIENLISSLKDESYQPKPSRRTYIPKKNGKMRYLGIPATEDKLLQEVVKMVLEASFEYTSHGFRPQRSCHTALKQIEKSFCGMKWYIEGDIKGFFDNINHDVMIGILEERINDVRSIRLIRKFHEECGQIKANITQFMKDKLKLELSIEKTLITHTQENNKFPGYEITIRNSKATKRDKNGVLKRMFNRKVVLLLPREVVKNKLIDYKAMRVIQTNSKEDWKPKARSYMMNWIL